MASAFGSCRPTSGWPSSSALCCTQRGAAVRRSPMLMLSRSARRAMPPWWCPPTQTTSPRSRPAYPAYGSSSDGRPMSERCADSDTAGAEDAKPAPASTVRLHRRHHRAPLHEGRFPRTLDEPQRDRPKQLRWKHQSEGSGYGRRRRPSLAVPAAGRYRVDPQRSTVTYSGRHLFGLAPVQATFTIASSELLVADPVAASTVVVSVDADSFRSDKSRRDDQVRSASLLDAATYPNITFTSDGLREQGAGWLLDGALTAHGQAKR